jgi:hypothetical protein
MNSLGTQLTRLLEWSVASRSLDPEAGSGDCYIVKSFNGGAILAVVDGLGHGREAAQAAKLTAATVHEYTEGSIISIFSRCHERLKETRGVVMSLALFNAADSTMTWAGVGNVEGLLILGEMGSMARKKSLIPARGVIGDRLPPMTASTKTMFKGDTVIFSTDGIRTGFDESLNLRSTPQEIADSILASHRRENDDALVLVARYLGT